MHCFVDPLSIQCQHLSVPWVLNRGNDPVPTRKLQPARAWRANSAALERLPGVVCALRHCFLFRGVVYTSFLSQGLASLVISCWRRGHEGSAQQKLSGHKTQLPVETIRLVLLVCQLRQVPQVQQPGRCQRHREHSQRCGHRFSTGRCHSHPASRSHCSRHHVAGRKHKRLLWKLHHSSN